MLSLSRGVAFKAQKMIGNSTGFVLKQRRKPFQRKKPSEDFLIANSKQDCSNGFIPFVAPHMKYNAANMVAFNIFERSSGTPDSVDDVQEYDEELLTMSESSIKRESFETKRDREIEELRDTLRKKKESFKLLKRLEPTIRLLQMFGYYRLPFQSTRPVSGQRTFSQFAMTCILTVFSLSLIAVNASLFTYNCIGMHTFRVRLGLLHALTVSWIITGLKPLVNVVQFALFFYTAKDHQHLFFQLQRVDDVFYDLTKKRANVSRINFYSIILISVSLILPFLLRIFDIWYRGANFFGHWLNTISPILVPLLTAWGLVPLIHFALMNHLVRFWFRALSKEIRKDSHLAKRSLEDYFGYYKLLTKTVYDMGLFNFFIGFSFAWSLISVCLAIYFVTQARILVDVPSGDHAEAMTVQIYFNLGWSLVQICVAVIFICTVSVSGFHTNEQALEVMMNVLAVNPRDPAKADSLQLNYFAHSLSCIKTWGISLFRSFPIQRSTLLTMTSLMFTYAILLMKLNPHTVESGNNENIGNVAAARSASYATALLSDTAFTNAIQNSTALPLL